VRKISILVVDDHAVFADALQARLHREPDLGPVWVAYSGAGLRAHLARHSPSVVVLDLLLGDQNGLDLAAEIHDLSPDTRTVILTAVESVEPVVIGLMRGVRAWLPKTIDTDHLVHVIRGVCAGEAYLSPSLLGWVLSEMVARIQNPASDPFTVLTAREHEVLQCMVDGLPRAKIAAALGVSVNTVRTHIQNVIAKLGTRSALETVSLALRNGYQGGGPLRTNGVTLRSVD
jgi:two-component system, NarL family, response regulator LiaR